MPFSPGHRRANRKPKEHEGQEDSGENNPPLEVRVQKTSSSFDHPAPRSVLVPLPRVKSAHIGPARASREQAAILAADACSLMFKRAILDRMVASNMSHS